MSVHNRISKLPNRNPKTLKIGSIKKSKVTGRFYKVSKTHKWVPASKTEINCDKYLKRKISKNIKEYKIGKNPHIKSPSQAIAIAYTQTHKHYPRCKKTKPLDNK